MKVYTAKRLSDYINEELKILKSKGVVKSRFCKNDLVTYLNSEDTKICGIYGLRRTGKTTLMFQTINEMNFADTAYIQCTKADDYIDVENLLDELTQKYIFIDEITKIENFINLSSSLSDSYPDKKIIITGTDSASLLFAKETELYNRIILIHTTYVSFAEYNYLLGKSLEDYIRYGGTLTDGQTIYNNEEQLEEYMNTSIVSNICKSVSKGKENISYRRLYDLYLNDSLETAINKTIEINAREFSLRVINSSFTKSHRFGSAKDLVLKSKTLINQNDIETVKNWKDHSEICEYISSQLKLESNYNIKQSDIELITNFLIKLDVLERMPSGEIFFTQAGMQYCFAETLIESIINTNKYQSLYPDTQHLILEKIHQDTVGYMLENIIRTDIKKHSVLSKTEIGKLDYTGEGEFDLYIINKNTGKAIVYEIKRSFVSSEQQFQHLINERFCNEFENTHNCKIIEKAVIYQGENKALSNKIIYYNAETFLLNLDSIYKKLDLCTKTKLPISKPKSR